MKFSALLVALVSLGLPAMPGLAAKTKPKLSMATAKAIALERAPSRIRIPNMNSKPAAGAIHAISGRASGPMRSVSMR